MDNVEPIAWSTNNRNCKHPMLDVSVERVWPLEPIQLSPNETQRLLAIICGSATKVNDLGLLEK